MTRGLRWRVFVLQVGLIGIFGFIAGFAFWGSGFASGQVQTQLAAQKITFPAAGSASLKALPAADAAAMTVYAGQQMTTGAQAETYADHFINVHLNEIAGGQTYSQVSAAAQANPTNAKLAAQVQTLFRGETLRGLLLNSYGWWQVGQYAFYAAIGLAVASAAVLLAFMFEIVGWRVSVKKERGARLTVHPAGSARAA
ncbi:MAG TPA: hypothetical protein VNY76_05825 [Candidatus Acidoferrales bacterium]|jgi:hypothetical protein|nr:hypothetical protein [Candidatus Acidoferrales bacterium]